MGFWGIGSARGRVEVGFSSIGGNSVGEEEVSSSFSAGKDVGGIDGVGVGSGSTGEISMLVVGSSMIGGEIPASVGSCGDVAEGTGGVEVGGRMSNATDGVELSIADSSSGGRVVEDPVDVNVDG